MLEILADRTYRRLFLAQITALMGTGLATVALGLLAYDIAGEGAAMVLGTVFAIKMIAYVFIAPVAGAFANRMNRRALLVALDLVRACAALALPFVTETWQIYGLIFVLQSASAAFTPTYQATLPDVLPDEARYTRALSLSRLAYDLENIASPTLAALLLLVVSSDALFLSTTLGFLGSALLVGSVVLPSPQAEPRRSVYDRTTRGARIYLATPRLRWLLSLNVTVSMVGAMVLVNTVVLVRGDLGLSEIALAWTMFAFGAGSMSGALLLPRILDHAPDRPVMFAGAVLMVVTLLGFGIGVSLAGLGWAMLLGAWLLIGFGNALVLTPAGRLLARSAHPTDRPALFAAQFALSHACWLVAYPAAGWLMTRTDAVVTMIGLALVGAVGLGLALSQWRASDHDDVLHTHDNLPLDHPHLNGRRTHRHRLVIDDIHPTWATHF